MRGFLQRGIPSHESSGEGGKRRIGDGRGEGIGIGRQTL